MHMSTNYKIVRFLWQTDRRVESIGSSSTTAEERKSITIKSQYLKDSELSIEGFSEDVLKLLDRDSSQYSLGLPDE